jgi:protein TonB
LGVLGAAISAAGHAAAIGLAVWALPWLRAGPDPGVRVVQVALVGPETLVPAGPSPPVPAPLSATRTEQPRPEATVPHPQVPEARPPVEDLARPFDPAAPFGFPLAGEGAPPAPVAAEPPAAAEAAPEAEAPPMSAEAFRAALVAAVERAKVYPRIARERGLFGTTGVALTLAPDGGLAAVRVARSSGSKALDEAAVAAVRAARLPAPPADMPLAYDLGISFTLNRD